MNSKTMLFECLGDYKETYLADNLCDGYRCPKCNGYIKPLGFIKDIEEGMREIRNYYKYYVSPKPPLPPNPNNYVGGVDLSDKKDHTIIINTNNPYIDKHKLAEEIIEKLNNPKGPARSGTIA